MKKQFFYAAMAIAMMASCTSEDSPVVDPITPDADDKVAIELGVDAPSVNTTVISKAVGSVGDTEASGANQWNGQQLYITMVDKDGVVAEDADGAILGYNTYNYYAPKDAESGLIKVYDKTMTNGDDKALIKNVYYPVSGTYDFYGWHVDDSNGLPSEDNPLLIENIKITGAQDIMGARTKAFTEDNYGSMYEGVSFGDMIGWDFSARTARNGITPILKFEHQLARLKFFVRAGSANTLKNEKLDGQETEETGAMKVTSIVAKNLADDLTMNLNSNGAIVTTTTDGEEGLADFTLKSRDENGTMVSLLPVAPIAVYDADIEDTKGEQVGESIMFFPIGDSEKSIELLVNLQQYVEIYEDETLENFVFNPDYWRHKDQEANLKIHASSVKLEGSTTPIQKFEAGKSYNVYITIYGFERIEVSAELTAWEMGGDVDVDVEEGESKRSVELGFDVTGLEEGVEPTIVVEQAGQTIAANNETGKFDVESFTTVKYTISAQGYETVSSYVNPETGKDLTVVLRAGQAMTIDAVNATAITVTEKGTANTVPAENGSYNMAIGATYMIKAEAAEGYVAKTVEHKVVAEETTVTIILDAEEPAQGGEEEDEEEETPEIKTFTATAVFPDDPENAPAVTYTAVPTEGETVTSTDGNLALIVGKTYTITATADGYTSQSQVVTVLSEEQTTTLTFEMEANGVEEPGEQEGN